jgi:Mg-chelatase subunit ChlD
MSTFNQNSPSSYMENDPDFPYLPPCMRCQPIIDYTSLIFHSDTIPYPIKIFNDEDSEYKFGILDIQIRPEIPINKKHIHMVFTIDSSGSMSSICSDRRTKIQHIQHTLENMLSLFHENNKCNISVHVQTFDSVVRTIINDVTNIHDANIEELITLIIQKITPSGSTNIELALEKASQEIYSHHATNPDHEIVHIFLTDGHITSGSCDYTHLLELVPKNCTNVFIGYGLNHDSELLLHLSREKGNEYRFIDASEKAGLVYGEVIHSILYKAIEDVTLSANSAELYNYQTNTWTKDIQIGNLVSEQMKTYHVRSKNIDRCSISINGKTIIKTRQFQQINIYEKLIDVRVYNYLSQKTDLGVYLFRQRTQELLYESRQFSGHYKKSYTPKYIINRDKGTTLEESTQSLQEKQTELKEKINEFYKTMINYMKDKNLESHPIMKMLCDDIYIAYKTTGTPLGRMYTCARQTSNGRQQIYMCSSSSILDLDIDNINYKPLGMVRLQRHTTDISSLMYLSSEQNIVPDSNNITTINHIDNYVPNQDILSPFSTPEVVSLMREVSGIQSL